MNEMMGENMSHLGFAGPKILPEKKSSEFRRGLGRVEKAFFEKWGVQPGGEELP